MSGSPFDISACISLNPENDRIGYEWAVESFRNWLATCPVSGPSHFRATIGLFDSAFRDWTVEPFDCNDAAMEGVLTPSGEPIPAGQQYHCVSVVLLDAVMANPIQSVTFAVVPAEDDQSPATEPVDGWGADSARQVIHHLMVEGAMSIQGDRLSKHFATFTFGVYGHEIGRFVHDAANRGISPDKIDAMIERKWLLDQLAVNLAEAAALAPEETSAAETMLFDFMAQTHREMVAEFESVIAEFANNVEGN